MHENRSRSLESALCLFLFVFPSLVAQEANQQKRFAIAVLDFEAREGVGRGEAASLSDVFSSELVTTGAFNVVDRKSMKSLLDEQHFQNSGLCSEMECIVEAGKILKVERIFAGTIGKVGRIYTVNIQLIDIATAQIVANKAYQHDGDIEDLAGKVMPNLADQCAQEQSGTIDLTSKGKTETRTADQSKVVKASPEGPPRLELKLLGPRAGVAYLTNNNGASIRKGIHSAFGWQVELPYASRGITGYGEGGFMLLGIEQRILFPHVWGYFGFRIKNFGIGVGPVISPLGVGIGFNPYTYVEVESLRIPFGVDVNFTGAATRIQLFVGFNFR